DAVEAGGRVEVLVEQQRHRGAARDDRLELLAAGHALRKGLAVDQLAQRRVHRRLVDTGALDVPADAKELRAAVLFGTHAGKPFGAVQHDERYVAERLDVVHRGRLLIQAGDRREGRLDARLRALAF